MKNSHGMKQIVVIYHRNCPDGFGGAWAAWKKFKNKAEYIALDPREFPKTEVKGREIYVIDNSYPKATLQMLMDTNKSVVVLDHHESAKADVEAFSQNIFDNEHSGAVLAWKYFHPKKSVPRLLKYVEDGDLWKHSLPFYKEILSYITVYPFDFSIWNTLAKKLENTNTRKECIRQGKIVDMYFERIVNDSLETADHVLFEGHKVRAVNFASKRFTSEIGNQLAKKYPPFAIVWYESDNVLHVSLRSIGSFDVAKIAEKYYGGGHKNAAGFKIPFTGKFPWTILEKK